MEHPSPEIKNFNKKNNQIVKEIIPGDGAPRHPHSSELCSPPAMFCLEQQQMADTTPRVDNQF